MQYILVIYSNESERALALTRNQAEQRYLTRRLSELAEQDEA